MTAAPFETVTYEKRGPVAHVVLDRPDVINAFSVQTRDDLSDVLYALRFYTVVAAALLWAWW